MGVFRRGRWEFASSGASEFKFWDRVVNSKEVCFIRNNNNIPKILFLFVLVYLFPIFVHVVDADFDSYN